MYWCPVDLVLNKPHRKNQVMLSLVIWQAVWCTVILFRSILQGTVHLRMRKKCLQSVVGPQLAGKLFHQGAEAQRRRSLLTRPWCGVTVCCLNSLMEQFTSKMGLHHTLPILLTFLDEQLPARWIGRGSSYITRPIRSPDLKLSEFFQWAFVKEKVWGTILMVYCIALI